ncbi:TPA: ABC transporter ATP-binding protein [Listeria monocytogenes]|nr:ABC transporter ATP-binding protein [Listeria monocytogenes]HDT8408213.1 ABC transporter ATP-binding protein [Listeria monocytogenes]HEL6870186.1 ABC transporter ATP-binding protein [Listeria monocytogenes]HEL7210343.1 ABC transporter ATP-binding protein [Listeria monocytogenes]
MNNILETKNLKVTINNKVILYLDKEVCISEKDKVAILGDNGAGKTTLVNSILGEKNSSGEITKKFKKNDCGVVFQENAYNDLMKVYELITLVLPHLKKKERAQFLHKYELESLRKKYIKDLSGGEKQRLTLCLVLESHKKLYIFDELTSGLDYKKRLGLLALMKEKTKDATVINITHYFEEVKNWATKVLILQKGILLFWGTISEFFSNFPHYSVIKVDQIELTKIDETDMTFMQSTDTGDGIAVICSDLQIQEETKKILDKKNVTYNTIKQNIYTTYLVAYLRGTSSSEQEVLI